MCNKLREDVSRTHCVWALALSALISAACASNPGDELAKTAAAINAAQNSNAATAAQTTALSDQNSRQSAAAGTGNSAGGGLGDNLGGGLANLANTFFPNLPLPANIGDLIKQLSDPNIIMAISQAISSNQCSSELQSLESLAQPLLTDPAALFGSLNGGAGGTPPNLQPVNDAANTFLKCITKAIPELAPALSNLASGSSKLLTAGGITTSSTGLPTELPVPSSILEVVEQLNMPPVMSALQRSRQANLCQSEFQALESISGPLLSRAPTLLEGLQSRPSEEIRPVTSAINGFLQCMAR